ncbi:hypothetical protein [Bradyrhizobium sp. LM6.9]
MRLAGIDDAFKLGIGQDANRPHIETLQERPLGDAFRELLDRNACLHPPHVRLAEHKFVERNVP